MDRFRRPDQRWCFLLFRFCLFGPFNIRHYLGFLFVRHNLAQFDFGKITSCRQRADFGDRLRHSGNLSVYRGGNIEGRRSFL